MRNYIPKYNLNLDPDHPITTGPIDESIEGVTRHTYSYIPCKPTSKSIEVEMKEEYYTLVDESQYDPTQGYLMHMYDNMKFSCQVKGKEESLKKFYVPACGKFNSDKFEMFRF